MTVDLNSMRSVDYLGNPMPEREMMTAEEAALASAATDRNAERYQALSDNPHLDPPHSFDESRTKR